MEIAEIIQRSSQLVLAGILTHSGHVYDASSPGEIPNVHAAAVKAMISVKRVLHEAGFKNISISVGDTPSSTLLDEFESEIDEIRPGNFIFYDWMQVELGSCVEEDIAAAVVCPVISKNYDRNEITIYGGRVHLSSETTVNESGQKCFGKVARPMEDFTGWTQSLSDVNLFSLSQEHGCMSAPREIVNSIQIGDVLVILPIHACITADLHSTFQTLDGKILDSFRL
jgi:D-serine deaminase-like pyridoxal phosphate-dependent protein